MMPGIATGHKSVSVGGWQTFKECPRLKLVFFLFWLFPHKNVGHISPTTLRAEVVEILFFLKSPGI